MKIGLFSDPHYCKADDLGLNRRPVFSLEKIKEAMGAFKNQGVELCFCLGDLVDHAVGDTKKEVLENLNEVLSVIRSYGIPFYLVPGNHDFADLTREDYINAGVDFPHPYSIIEAEDCDFLLIDANIRSSGKHFDTEGHVWDDANIVEASFKPVFSSFISTEKKHIVLVHENLDPTVQEQHIIKNAESVRKVINESGRVKLVIQGHFHYGSDWYDGEIHYHTVKAMCLGKSNYYEIIEL